MYDEYSPQAFGRLEGKVDQILKNQETQGTRLAEVEDRVRHLETLKGKILGVAAALAAVASGGVTWLIRIFQ